MALEEVKGWGIYFDASMISYLDIFDKIDPGHDYTSAFVTANQWELGWDRPIALPGVQVGVADT